MSSRKLRNPDDGELYDVPEADVDAALAAGYSAGEKLINPDDGDEYEVPHADVEAARAAGYAPRAPTPEPAAAAAAPAEPAPAPETLSAGPPVPQAVAEAGSGLVDTLGAGARKFNQEVLTAGESLASLGGLRGPLASLEAIPGYLADVVTPGKDADYERSFRETEAAMLKRRDENVVGDTVGSFAQAVLPLGLGGKALKAVEYVAPGAVQLARKVPGLLASYLLPAEAKVAAVAGKLILGAGLAGAENVAQGAARELDESLATGDTSKLKERIGARAYEDFKSGAVIGGIVGGVQQVGALGIKRAKNSAANALDVASDDLTKKVTDLHIEIESASQMRAVEARELEAARVRLDVADASEVLESKASGELERQLALSAPKAVPAPADDMARYVQAYEGHKGFRAHAEESTPRLQELLNVIQDNAEYADANLGLKQKNAAIRAAENGYGQAIRDPEVVGTFDALLSDIAEHKTDALDVNNAGLARLEKLAKRGKDIVGGKLEAGDVGDAFVTITNINREIGAYAASPKRGPLRDMARVQYDRFKTLAEREDLFGEAAKLQRPFNAVWAPEISAAQADGLGGMLGNSGVKSAHDSFDKAYRVKGSFVENHLKSTAINTDVDTALRQRIATQVASQSVKSDLLGDAVGAERAARSRAAAAEAFKILDDNARFKAGAREWASLSEDLRAKKLIGESGVMGAVRDVSEGVLVKQFGAGKLADLVAGRFTKSQLERDLSAASIQAEKASVARRAAAAKLATEATRAQVRLNKAAKRVGTVTVAADRATTALDAVGEAARRATITATLKSAEDEENAEVDNHAGPLSALTPVLGEQLAGEVVEQRRARNAFLLEKAGPKPSPSVFNGAPKRVLSDDTVATLTRYKNAADDPTAAIDRMADGTASVEDRETLEALYPQMLGEFREKAVASIADRKADVPYDQQLRVSAALGVPLTAEQQPEALSFWQGFGKTQASMKTPKSNNVKLNSDGARSKADRIG